MKPLHYLLLISVLLFSACNNYKAELDKLKEEQEALSKKIGDADEEDKLIRGEYAEAIDALNAIEDSLSSIADRDKEIKALSNQMELTKRVSQREKILEKMNALRKANDDARDQARQLQYALKKYRGENELLRKMIDQAEERVATTDEKITTSRNTINELSGVLNKMEKDLDETKTDLASAYQDLKSKTDKLEQINVTLQSKIDELRQKDDFIDRQANAYVACGTKKLLRQKGILSKTTSKLDKDYRETVRASGTMINYHNSSEIQCGSDGTIEMVLPSRDPSSYTIDGATLTITNDKDFWKTDNIVVLIKK